MTQNHQESIRETYAKYIPKPLELRPFGGATLRVYSLQAFPFNTNSQKCCHTFENLKTKPCKGFKFTEWLCNFAL